MSTDSTVFQREIKQRQPFRSAAQEATVALLHTADAVRSRLSDVVEPHGVTLQQYNVLRILRGVHPDPLPTLEISDRLIERQPGITGLLDRLEGKGLVRRERGPEDRRLVHAWITAEGLELLARLDGPVDEADDSAVAALSGDEIRMLTGLLERVRRRG